MEIEKRDIKKAITEDLRPKIDDIELRRTGHPSRRWREELRDYWQDLVKDSSEKLKDGADKMLSRDPKEREEGQRMVRGAMEVGLSYPYGTELYGQLFTSAINDPIYANLNLPKIERDVMKQIVGDQATDSGTLSEFNSVLDTIKSQDKARRFSNQVLISVGLQERMERPIEIDTPARELAERIIASYTQGVLPSPVALVAAASEVARARNLENSSANATARDILNEVVKDPNASFQIPQSVIRAFDLKGPDATGKNTLEVLANKIDAGLRLKLTGEYKSVQLGYARTGEDLVDYVIKNASSPEAVDRELTRIKNNLDTQGILGRIAKGENHAEMSLRRTTTE